MFVMKLLPTASVEWRVPSALEPVHTLRMPLMVFPCWLRGVLESQLPS